MLQEKEWRQSLRSAQVVQQGMLPKKRHFNRLFTDSFVYFQPKDVLSGDFFWVGRKHELRYLVVGDCTGHGISASLVSVLALNLLEYVIMNKGIKKAHKILEEVDKRFIESFKGLTDESFDNPWIDLSLISINDETGKMYFASANRKMLHVTSNEKGKIYKSVGYPIGGWQIKEDRKFETTTIDFKVGDRVYLGSDGMQDQFGGPDDKKFGSGNLHRFLSQISDYSFGEQYSMLDVAFRNWKKDHPQTDDICVVGVEL